MISFFIAALCHDQCDRPRGLDRDLSDGDRRPHRGPGPRRCPRALLSIQQVSLSFS